jgi:hypothetical protein
VLIVDEVGNPLGAPGGGNLFLRLVNVCYTRGFLTHEFLRAA